MVVPPEMERRCANYAAKKREEFRWIDGQGRLVRALIGFYGANPVGEALMRANPENVPARLGRAAEFWRLHGDLRPGAPPAPATMSAAAEDWAARLSGGW